MVRKATLASIVAEASPGIRFNERIEGFRKISGTGQKLWLNLKAGFAVSLLILPR